MPGWCRGTQSDDVSSTLASRIISPLPPCLNAQSTGDSLADSYHTHQDNLLWITRDWSIPCPFRIHKCVVWQLGSICIRAMCPTPHLHNNACGRPVNTSRLYMEPFYNLDWTMKAITKRHPHARRKIADELDGVPGLSLLDLASIFAEKWEQGSEAH